VHLVGSIIRIYHDALSHERQFITMHGHLNVNLSRCTAIWTSIYHDARSPECQFITMHDHLNVNLSRCTVTWTSIYHDSRSPERQFITMHGHLNVNLSRRTVTWTSIYHDARSPERQKCVVNIRHFTKIQLVIRNNKKMKFQVYKHVHWTVCNKLLAGSDMLAVAYVKVQCSFGRCITQTYFLQQPSVCYRITMVYPK